MGSLGLLAAKTAPPIDPEMTAKAIADDCAERAAQRAAEPKRLNLMRLPILRNELRSLRTQRALQAEKLLSLPGEVARLEREVKDRKKQLAHAQKFTDVSSAIAVRVKDMQKWLTRYEEQLEAAQTRLTLANKLHDAVTKLIDEWHSVNDKEFDELCALESAVDGSTTADVQPDALEARGNLRADGALSGAYHLARDQRERI